MNTPVFENACPECGSPMETQGLCARCLLAGAAAPTEPVMARSSPPSLEEVRAAFPQLEVQEMIGHGGMGAVYKVRQPKLNRWAALKLLPATVAADPAFAGRFEREAQLLARLSHPNITAVYDYGQAGEFYYLLMEFIDGVNLRQAMRTSRFTPAQALGIVPKICEALQYAHEEGVLHRDIKPENILLDGKGRVKLADFGIAKIVAESEAELPSAIAAGPTITQGGAALGTPQYMAPEQREAPAEVDHRADIYSLGVVFYELLTGKLPVGKFAPPSAISATDPRVDAIVQQALERERERRQHSAGEMKTQVEQVRSAPAPPLPPYAQIPDTELRKMVAVPAFGLMAAAGLNLLLFTGVLVIALFFIPWKTTPGGDVAIYSGSNSTITLTSHSLTGANPAWSTIAPLMLQFGLLPSLVTFFGALRMRHFRGYGHAVIGAILGMLTPPGLLIGFIFGIWALVALGRQEVRDRFRVTPTEPRSVVRGPAYSLLAISGLTLVMLGQLLFAVLIGAKWEVTPTGDVLKYASTGLSFTLGLPHTGVHPGLLTLAPIILILAIVPAVTFLGAWRMRQLRGYGVAIAAAILGTTLGAFTPCGTFTGVAIGIWALAVLLSRKVRASFDGGMPRRRRGGILIAFGTVAAAFVLMLSWIVIGCVLYSGASFDLHGASNGSISMNGWGEVSAKASESSGSKKDAADSAPAPQLEKEADKPTP